jgi:hypothetical protein
LSKKYILNSANEPEECTELLKWASWFETADRIVKKSIIGDVRISTVFLSIDHNFSGGKPILWETLVFGGEHDGLMRRYGTYDKALKGHDKVVALVTGKEGPL